MIILADWITTTNGIITLITGLCGLVGTGIGAFFAIKNFIKLCKEKSAKEIWNMIISAADTAMKTYESSTMSGADKKKAVIEAVKTSLAAQGLDISAFLDQLDAYIDDCIKFYNDMTAATESK